MQRLIPTDIVARLSKLACRKSQKDLHDFRVILHRMESWASLLKDKDLYFKIHQLVKQTNYERDLEVQIEWFNKIGYTKPIPSLNELKYTHDSKFQNPHDAIQKNWKILDKQIQKIHTRKDIRLIHKARLTAKDIRYWLEEIRPKTLLIQTQIKYLKKLQSILGDLHDLHRIIKDLKSEKLDSAKIAYHKLKHYEKILFKKFQCLSMEDTD